MSSPVPQHEVHEDPTAFTNSFAAHAQELARAQSGGADPTEPVELQATVTVSKTPQVTICIHFGKVTICFPLPSPT